MKYLLFTQDKWGYWDYKEFDSEEKARTYIADLPKSKTIGHPYVWILTSKIDEGEESEEFKKYNID